MKKSHVQPALEIIFFFTDARSIEISNIRPPRAPWGPLDSGLMMRSHFSPFFKKDAKRIMSSKKSTGRHHLGFDPGFDHGFDPGFDRGFDSGFDPGF